MRCEIDFRRVTGLLRAGEKISAALTADHEWYEYCHNWGLLQSARPLATLNLIPNRSRLPAAGSDSPVHIHPPGLVSPCFPFGSFWIDRSGLGPELRPLHQPPQLVGAQIGAQAGRLLPQGHTLHQLLLCRAGGRDRGPVTQGTPTDRAPHGIPQGQGDCITACLTARCETHACTAFHCASQVNRQTVSLPLCLNGLLGAHFQIKV